MISSSFNSHLEHVIGCTINKIEPVSGGDISSAFCIHTSTNRFFCKTNQSENASKMFMSEQLGLAELSNTKTIKVPKVYLSGLHKGISFILMEFIEGKSPSNTEMELFGHQLAELHNYNCGTSFGWQQDNFIGSLNQSNKNHQNWTQFYVSERLLPQLKLARNKELLQSNEIPKDEVLLQMCENLSSKIKPSLLHGDLWSGNYLIKHDGTLYLIDPAVYMGHNEIDLAMTHLFGGFSSIFYKAYEEVIPNKTQINERKDIYQLYYLLVHLNLFGSSYYTAVKQILKRYFD